MTNTTPAQCNARVQMGSYTYMARNTDRQCANRATQHGYCHRHQSRYVAPADRWDLDALKAALLRDATS